VLFGTFDHFRAVFDLLSAVEIGEEAPKIDLKRVSPAPQYLIRDKTTDPWRRKPRRAQCWQGSIGHRIRRRVQIY